MSASNYADVLAQLQTAGLIVLELQTGRIVRCRVEGDREKRGWYTLHEIVTKDGDLMIVGTFGVWQGSAANTQKVDIRKDAFSSEQRESLRRRMAEDKRRADAMRAAQAKAAAERARKAWAKCDPTGENDYLARKGVGAHGVRFSPSGALVIPLLDDAGNIHGLQIIRSPKAATAEHKPEKEFWPAGTVKKAHFHLIGIPAAIVLMAEGYATGATLHEATGLPVAIAWDAGNLAPVATALRKRYPRAKILFCADDDDLAKCAQCRERLVLSEHPKECPKCGQPHGRDNAGVIAASSASVEVGNAAFVRPVFDDEPARRAAFLSRGVKHTDFNDLHAREGLHVVRTQIESRLTELAWSRLLESAARTSSTGGTGAALRSIESVDDLLERFALIYAGGQSVFDRAQHCVVTLSDMRDACRHRETHRAWMQHPDRAMVLATEVDFDPGCSDPKVTCNLWAGWPTTPRAGKCERLLELLRHMCSGDVRAEELFQWVLRWIAYPIQRPGAKMKTTLVLHGPQGTGKNMFFEAVMAIYGEYGRVIDQGAIEDKFNDWASRRLFLIADEVVARNDLYHIKNKLKAFITGEWIRINPKNMAARDERNHVNMVFLSNESMPVALDEDDRRHVVIWTPDKLTAAFYDEVKAELDNGGSAALHDYLLNVDLGDFRESTAPPYTDAKEELIKVGRDSVVLFHDDLMLGEIGTVPYAPALAKDAYGVYKSYCAEQGLRSAPLPKFVNALARKCKVPSHRKRYLEVQSIVGPRAILFFGGVLAAPEGQLETTWLGDCVEAFKRAADDTGGKRP